jgi:hypothetical protein
MQKQVSNRKQIVREDQKVPVYILCESIIGAHFLITVKKR